MTESFGPIVVTAKDIHEKVTEIAENVHELKATQAATLGRVTDQVARINDHEDRIRRLEAWRYALPVSALAAIVSAVVAISQAIGH